MTKEYTGFHFAMGAFMIWNDTQVLIGQCNPLTKEVLNIITVPDKDGYMNELNPRDFKGLKVFKNNSL